MAWKVGSFKGVGFMGPSELEELAKAEINEDPKRRSADITAIKTWFRAEPHLQEIEIGKLHTIYCMSAWSNVSHRSQTRTRPITLFRATFPIDTRVRFR